MATFVLFCAGLGDVIMGVVKLAVGQSPQWRSPGVMYWSVAGDPDRVRRRGVGMVPRVHAADREATHRGIAQWPPRKGAIGEIVSGRQPVLASTRFGRVMFWLTVAAMFCVLLVFAFWGLFIY